MSQAPLKATSVKDALQAWSKVNKENPADAQVVKLLGQLPPIERMDNALSTLVNCRFLSLSTNSIEKITGLASLHRLETLSLGRNQIKSLSGIEAVADTLQSLWISYNNIDRIGPLVMCKHLRVLYISCNKISSWNEIERLGELSRLEDLLLTGNPIEDKYKDTEKGQWRHDVIRRLGKTTNLKKLDTVLVGDEERELAFGGGASDV